MPSENELSAVRAVDIDPPECDLGELRRAPSKDVTTPKVSTRDDAIETAAAQAWSVVQNTTSAAVLEEFARRFSNSIYAGFARARIEEIRKDEATWRPPSKKEPSSCESSHGDYVVVNVKWNDPDGGLIVSSGPGMHANRLGVIPASGVGIGIGAV